MSTDVGEIRARMVLEMTQFRREIDEVRRNLRDLEERTDGAGDSAKRTEGNVRNLGIAFGALTAAMAGVIAKSVEVAATFEQSMAKVKAITGATADEFKRLQDQSLELGATTVFTASQAADAQGFLAMAGFKTNEILAAMPGVLNLAAAGQMDLARTADIASNILTGFQLSAEETGRVVDVLARTMTNANTNIEQLGYAAKYVAPIAATTGVSIEDTAAAIAKLSDAGIQGEMAGTQLRMMLLRLVKPTKRAQDILDQLGVSIIDEGGNIREFTDIIGSLETAFGGLSEAARTQAAAILVGVESTSGFLTLLNTGADELKRFSADLENAGGTAQRIADIQLDTFNGSVIAMKSALEGVGITVGNDFIPIMRSAAEAVTRALLGFNEMDSGLRVFLVTFPLLTGGVGTLITGIYGLYAALQALSAAGIIAKASLGWIAVAAAAAGTLGAAFISYRATASEAAKAQAEFNAQLEKAPFERTAEDVNNLRDQIDSLNGLLVKQAELVRKIDEAQPEGFWANTRRVIAGKSSELVMMEQQLRNVEQQLKVTFDVKTPEDAARRIEELNGQIQKSIPALADLLKEELKDTAAKQSQIEQTEKLSDRYSELSRQTTLTAAEKSELARVVGELTDKLPGLSTELDENGRLIITNESSVRSLITAEKDAVNSTVENAKKRTEAWRIETQQKLDYAKTQLKALAAISESGSKTFSGPDDPYGLMGDNPTLKSAALFMRQVTDGTKTAYEREVSTYTNALNDINGLLAKLDSGDWSSDFSGTGGGLGVGGEGDVDFTRSLRKDKSGDKKAKKEKTAEQIAQESYRASLQYIEKKRLLNQMSEQQELAALATLADKHKKYDDIWIDATKRRNQLADQMAAADKKRADDETRRQEDATKAAQKAARDKFDASAEWIDMETRRMTEKGESERDITEMQLAAWTRVRNRYEKDSDFYKRADREMYNARMSLRKQDEQAAKEAAQNAEKSTKELTKSVIDSIDKQRKAELEGLEVRKKATKDHYDDLLRIVDEYERGRDRKKIEEEAEKYRFATSEKGRKRYEELQEQLRKMDVEDNKKALAAERDDKLAALDRQKADIDSWYSDLKATIEDFNGDFISIYQTTEDERFAAFVETNAKIKAEMERFKSEMASITAAAAPAIDPYQQSLVYQMQANSNAWKSADAAGKQRLAAENQRLGTQVGATYNSGEGRWYKDSVPLYHTGGIAGEQPFSVGQMLMPDELTAILRRGEVVLTPEQITQLVGGRAAAAGTVHIETLVGMQVNEPTIEDNVDLNAYGRNAGEATAEMLRRAIIGGGGGVR